MFNHLKFSKTFFICSLIFLLVLTTSVLVFFLLRGQKIVITTETQEYASGQDLKLQIKSSFLLKRFCFSSCYPYFLEKNNGEWRTYSYVSCPFFDKIETCIGPRESKIFLISLPAVKPGKHRISVPVCQDCQSGQEFQETGRFFSNEFEVK